MGRHAKKGRPNEGSNRPPAREAMVQNSDIVYSATQHIDRLMRRVVLLMFGAGVLSGVAVRHLAAVDGTIDPIDRVGYPAMVLVFSASFVALWRFPKVLVYVRWIGFLS